MTNLAEIARVSGFSISTVGRVLNPRPNSGAKVAEETRAVILSAARRLGYRPNRTAEFFKRGQIPAIGVFMPHFRTSLVTDLVMGISEAAAELGFPLEYAFDTTYEKYRRFLEKTSNQCNCGLITYPNFRLDAQAEKLINDYLLSGGKMVLINAGDCMPQIPRVEIDDTEGGRLAARTLLKAGCKKLVVLNDSLPARVNGFVEIAGTPVVLQGKEEQNFSRVVEMGKNSAPGELGVFVTADREAVHLHSLLVLAGVIPGRDVKLIGYDDLFLTSELSPALTTISQPFGEVGRNAVFTLVDLIYGKPVKNVKLFPKLVSRETL